MTRHEDHDRKTWVWKVDASFNPEYDATAQVDGVLYYCEIQGPFCGYDRVGFQTWDEFLANGPLDRVEMPSDIAAEVRAFGLAIKARDLVRLEREDVR